MKDHRFVSGFFARIGACRKCMRQSFLAMLVAWGAGAVVASAAPLIGSQALLALTIGAAGLLTLVWLVHLTVFALRAVRAGARLAQPAPEGADTGRRRFITGFASAFAGIALATMLPAHKAAASSYRGCNTNQCGGNTCCPSDAPYLSHCDCRCYASGGDTRCGSYSYCSSDC